MSTLLPRIYLPSVYQGRKTPRNYFEGWYFKIIDSGGKQIWSIIPGISYSDDTHCFVQVIHANSGKTFYHRYAIDSFSSSRKKFHIHIGPNQFSDKSISLAISDKEIHLNGKLYFRETHPFPASLLSPGIMGWYTFVPFMECYHGVVSMQHGLSGSLEINGSKTDFEGGKGYIEKDWGRSMPSDWIWMQSNHFTSNNSTSFMLSLARIPWMKGHFPGFLSFLLLHGRVYRFATYNRSEVSLLEISPELVRVVITHKKFRLEVKTYRQDGGILKAPRHGNMDREIKESIISTLSLELKSSSGALIYSDTGLFSGLEIVGDMEQYY